MNDLIWFFVCFGLIATSWVLLGMWAYLDATNKGINAKLWTFIVLFGPSGIGLLIYLLVARKQSFVKCPYCSNSIPSDSKYCNKCGNIATEIKVKEKKPTKHLIVGFVVSFVLAISCFFVGFITSEDFEFKSGMSFFLVEVNTKEKWNISYYKSTAKFSRTIEKQEDQTTLYVDASCDEGKLYLKVTQDDIDTLLDIY